MITRQSHNAELQQHCCTTCHSSCSNCPPSAAAHTRSRFRHSFTAPSIMR